MTFTTNPLLVQNVVMDLTNLLHVVLCSESLLLLRGISEEQR